MFLAFITGCMMFMSGGIRKIGGMLLREIRDLPEHFFALIEQVPKKLMGKGS